MVFSAGAQQVAGWHAGISLNLNARQTVLSVGFALTADRWLVLETWLVAFSQAVVRVCWTDGAKSSLYCAVFALFVMFTHGDYSLALAL
jgi:hypothetical protein